MLAYVHMHRTKLLCESTNPFYVRICASVKRPNLFGFA